MLREKCWFIVLQWIFVTLFSYCWKSGWEYHCTLCPWRVGNRYEMWKFNFGHSGQSGQGKWVLKIISIKVAQQDITCVRTGQSQRHNQVVTLSWLANVAASGGQISCPFVMELNPAYLYEFQLKMGYPNQTNSIPFPSLSPKLLILAPAFGCTCCHKGNCQRTPLRWVLLSYWVSDWLLT